MTLRILLASSDAEDVLFLRDVLEEMEGGEYWSGWLHLEIFDTPAWADAQAILSAEPIDVLLLSLNLGDSQGAETFRRAQAAAPHVPVVLLIEDQQLETARRLIREGAQDYLVKKHVDSEPLAHAIRNALERSRLLAAARAAAMTDPLTGLLNRSAFQLFADRDRRIAERCASRMAVLVAEPKGFPAPGGEYAEQHRDLLLVEAADQLRAAAGPTDLLARIGDRRFAVSLIETLTESIESAWARFRSSGAPLTIGVAIFNPMHPVSLDALIEQAEADAGASQAAASSA